jgi:SAM-dependent methyltransferase
MSDERSTTESTNRGFLGGPPELFERAGRESLIVLLEHGLAAESTVLDIGCGVLRGGRWIIPLLDPEHYCGIEPQRGMVERGLREFVPSDVVRIKRPRFDHNDRFDFSVFGTRFSHFLARSVWTHTSKRQIETMLDGVREFGTEDAVLLASFLEPSRFANAPHPVKAVLRRLGSGALRPDYLGWEWVGRSDRSNRPGMVAHRFSWIRAAAARRGLEATLVGRPPLTRHGQIWARIRRAGT